MIPNLPCTRTRQERVPRILHEDQALVLQCDELLQTKIHSTTSHRILDSFHYHKHHRILLCLCSIDDDIMDIGRVLLNVALLPRGCDPHQRTTTRWHHSCTLRLMRHKSLQCRRLRCMGCGFTNEIVTELASAGGLQDTLLLLIFSAAPFVLVQKFADSDAGKEIYERLKREKPALELEAARKDDECKLVRKNELQDYFGSQRPLWLPGQSYTPPKWLDGSRYPGDYGFDPLGLGEEEKDLKRYFELELLHGRWAMLGALGACIPELLNQYTPLNIPEARWWNIGAYKAQSGEDLNYFGIEGLRIAGNQGIWIIFICQIVLMYGPEYARSCGREALEPLGIFLPGDTTYPGGWLFDPLNLAKSPKQFELMKVREIKHGRLAMTAWVIFALQAYWTKEGIFDWIFRIAETHTPQ